MNTIPQVLTSFLCFEGGRVLRSRSGGKLAVLGVAGWNSPGFWGGRVEVLQWKSCKEFFPLLLMRTYADIC